MASIWVNQGLIRLGRQGFGSTAFSSGRRIQVMSVDDSTAAFAAGHTALNSGGSVTNEFDQAFDATPTESGQTIACVVTYGTTNANFTIRRIALHDDSTSNVTSTSNTLSAGIDGQTIAKSSDFSVEFTLNTTFSSV